MFGIGEMSDIQLLEKSAKVGKGMAYVANDINIFDLRYMMIDALQRASEPSLQNCSLQFSQGG